MFLIVFITLMVSVIGLYAQILSLQTAKIDAAQSAMAQTMITWHAAAVDYVHANITTFTALAPALPLACQLTSTSLLYTMSACVPGYTLATVTPAVLPSVYNAAFFPFLTAVFNSNSTIYVVTYITAPSAASGGVAGNLQLPADPNLSLSATPSVTVGYTINDVMRQFANISANYLAYGTVTTAGTLTIGGRSNGAVAAGITFPVPPASIMPVGAVAIISAAN
jgi:hypothetical protein